MRTLRPAELTADERERTRYTVIPCYIQAIDKIMPIGDLTENTKLDVPCHESHAPNVRRSIYRMCSKWGKIVSCEVLPQPEDRVILRFIWVADKQVTRFAPQHLRRDWDPLLSPDHLKLVRRRREEPDGMERRVRVAKRADQEINVYPWKEMRDGDYFIVPMRRGDEKERLSMRNAFREASCRYDYEIQVKSWEINSGGELIPGLRVTRIQPNLRKLKQQAAERVGKHANPSRGRAAPARHKYRDVNKAINALKRLGVPEAEARALIELKGNGVALKKDSVSTANTYSYNDAPPPVFPSRVLGDPPEDPNHEFGEPAEIEFADDEDIDYFEEDEIDTRATGSAERSGDPISEPDDGYIQLGARSDEGSVGKVRDSEESREPEAMRPHQPDAPPPVDEYPDFGLRKPEEHELEGSAYAASYDRKKIMQARLAALMEKEK